MGERVFLKPSAVNLSQNRDRDTAVDSSDAKSSDPNRTPPIARGKFELGKIYPRSDYVLSSDALEKDCMEKFQWDASLKRRDSGSIQGLVY